VDRRLGKEGAQRGGGGKRQKMSHTTSSVEESTYGVVEEAKDGGLGVVQGVIPPPASYIIELQTSMTSTGDEEVVKPQLMNHTPSVKEEVDKEGEIVTRQLMNWHCANAEYGNGAPLDKTSLRWWDVDSDAGFPGEHCWVKAAKIT